MSVVAITLRGYGPVADVGEVALRGYGSGGEETVEEGETTPAPDGKIGAAKAGMNIYDKSARRRQQALQEEDDFLQIIKIALPEIMKYLK